MCFKSYENVHELLTDGWTDRRAEGRTDSYSDYSVHLRVMQLERSKQSTLTQNENFT